MAVYEQQQPEWLRKKKTNHKYKYKIFEIT